MNHEFTDTHMSKEEYEKSKELVPFYPNLTEDKIRKAVSDAWNKVAAEKLGIHTIGL